MKQELHEEAGRVEESARYASETQFEYAKAWRRIDRWLAAAAALLAAIAGVGALAEVLGLRVAGAIAILSAGIGAVAASINAPQTKEKAGGSANAYRALQQDARVFREIDLPGMDDTEARGELGSLVARLQDLNQSAEIPSPRAWKRAKAQIDAGAQSYEVDEGNRGTDRQ